MNPETELSLVHQSLKTLLALRPVLSRDEWTARAVHEIKHRMDQIATWFPQCVERNESMALERA